MDHIATEIDHGINLTKCLMHKRGFKETQFVGFFRMRIPVGQNFQRVLGQLVQIANFHGIFQLIGISQVFHQKLGHLQKRSIHGFARQPLQFQKVHDVIHRVHLHMSGQWSFGPYDRVLILGVSSFMRKVAKLGLDP
eukprot:02469.XXX_72596_73006_1 [CDS] Oithona nana genome sequencing.